jgi:hypothetical protein
MQIFLKKMSTKISILFLVLHSSLTFAASPSNVKEVPAVSAAAATVAAAQAKPKVASCDGNYTRNNGKSSTGVLYCNKPAGSCPAGWHSASGGTNCEKNFACPAGLEPSTPTAREFSDQDVRAKWGGSACIGAPDKQKHCPAGPSGTHDSSYNIGGICWVMADCAPGESLRERRTGNGGVCVYGFDCNHAAAHVVMINGQATCEYAVLGK